MNALKRNYKDCKFGNVISQSDIVPYIVEHWTEQEKVILFKLLQKHGSKNHTAIAAELSSKTKQEVTEAIEYYKKTSLKIHGSEMGRRGRELRPKDPHNALDLGVSFWISSFMKTYPSAKLVYSDELSKAITIIVENNDFPLPENANDIEFKNIYLNIAKALVGKQGPPLNNTTALILKKMVNYYLNESLRVLLNPNIEYYLNLMKRPHESVLPIKAVAIDQEVQIMEYLVSLRRVNPFGMDLDSVDVQPVSEPETYEI